MAAAGEGVEQTLIGVDGCRSGWVCVARRVDRFEAWISPDISSIVARGGVGSLIGIDVPIGFARCTSRACDAAARVVLRERASTVFSPPVRAALAASSHAEACRINREVCGKGISLQSFGLYPKLREVDEFLASHPEQRHLLLEVHPEVSFALWHGRPLQHGKKTAQGRVDRMALIEKSWPGLVAQLRVGLGRSGYGMDDLLDAIAVLWSTIRYASRTHQAFPEPPDFDDLELRMQIIG
jgi:predicted RNase H-like nuclease